MTPFGGLWDQDNSSAGSSEGSTYPEGIAFGYNFFLKPGNKILNNSNLSSGASELQGPQFYPELGLLSVWTFACSPHLQKTSGRFLLMKFIAINPKNLASQLT